MIDKNYVLTMARYNAWQNKQIVDIVNVMDEEALWHDHKAFFGSIMGTLNHILWGDTLWMSRWCDDVKPPSVPGTQSTDFTDTLGEWQAERFVLDGRIRIWGETLSNLDLSGEESWYSGALQRDFTQKKTTCIIHFFNHQTHHRGQVHGMLTATGRSAPTTDLIFMPKDA
jgi:uncharacterized damage-inducible protein DinB